jgi:tetratricopeptide (TPR) repeat protein
MGNKFQKKNLAQLKKQEEAILDRDLEDFQGTATELFYIKLTRKIQRKRIQVLAGVGVVFVIFASVVGYLEYSSFKEMKSTEKLELILESWTTNPLIPTKDKISVMENFHANDSSGDVSIRTSKILADLYVQEKDFTKAAELLEASGKKIDPLRESKAYYFFLAGNYRELAGEKDLALGNYETAASLVDALRETPSFKAWALYHVGRLKYEKGDKNGASDSLRKVLTLEPGDVQADLEEVKKLSTFLLLKLSKIN